MLNNETQLNQLKRSMIQIQQKASSLYESLNERRLQLIRRLNAGLHQLAHLQRELINRLREWKNMQKIAQIGASFDGREQQLDAIQQEYVCMHITSVGRLLL